MAEKKTDKKTDADKKRKEPDYKALLTAISQKADVRNKSLDVMKDDFGVTMGICAFFLFLILVCSILISVFTYNAMEDAEETEEIIIEYLEESTPYRYHDWRHDWYLPKPTECPPCDGCVEGTIESQ